MVFLEEEGMDTGFLTRNVPYPVFQMKESRHGVVKNIRPRPQSQWTPPSLDPKSVLSMIQSGQSGPPRTLQGR